MKIAIISQNKHSYLPESPNEKAYIVRTIIPNGIHLFNEQGGISIYCKFYALLENNTLFEIKTTRGNSYHYSEQQINGLFKALNDPIFPNENFISELQKIATLILINETNSSDFFGGDTYTIYNEKNKRISKKNN